MLVFKIQEGHKSRDTVPFREQIVKFSILVLIFFQQNLTSETGLASYVRLMIQTSCSCRPSSQIVKYLFQNYRRKELLYYLEDLLH